MPRESVALTSWGTSDSVESGKLAFRHGDILFGKLRPYFHKVGVAPVDGVCSTDIVVLRPRPTYWGALVLSIVSSRAFVAYTTGSSTGTRMPRTNWSTMSDYRFARPSQPVNEAFESLLQPSLAQIVQLTHASRKLTALRDALLPRLVSGALRVDGVDV